MTDMILCKCGQKYRIPPKFAGKRIKCRKCGNAMSTPKADEEEYAEVVEDIEDLDDYIEDEDTPPPVPRRKKRSKRRSPGFKFESAKWLLVPTARILARIIMTFYAMVTLGFLLVHADFIIISIPAAIMCILGLAGVNGRGIAVNRNFTIEGDRALTLGSVLIILASCWPLLLMGYIAGLARVIGIR